MYTLFQPLTLRLYIFRQWRAVTKITTMSSFDVTSCIVTLSLQKICGEVHPSDHHSKWFD